MGVPHSEKGGRCLVVELGECELPSDSIRAILLDARRLASKLIIIAPNCGLAQLYAVLREIANNNMDFPVRAYSTGFDPASEGCLEVIKRVVPHG